MIGNSEIHGLLTQRGTTSNYLICYIFQRRRCLQILGQRLVSISPVVMIRAGHVPTFLKPFR